MAEGKQYFTVKDVFDATVKLRKLILISSSTTRFAYSTTTSFSEIVRTAHSTAPNSAYWVMCPMVKAKGSTVTSTCMVAGAKIRMISAAIVHASMYSKRSTAIRSRIWRSACWSISSATTQTSLSQSTWIILIKEELHHA